MDSHSLGLYLKETREAKELTLDEAVTALKIRRPILESFERGEFALTESSPVQVRGFIRNYAHYLGLDDDLVLQYYESSLHNNTTRRRGKRGRTQPTREAQKPATKPKRRRPFRRQSRRRTRRPGEQQTEEPERPLVAARSITDTDPAPPRVSLGEQRESSRERVTRLLSTITVFLVAVAAITVIGFVVLQLIEEPADLAVPEDSNILQALPNQPTSTFAPTFTPRPTISALPPIQQEFSGSGVAVTIETQQRTFLRVTTDNNLQIERLVLPGELFDYRALDEIYVSASNAESLVIIYNGQPQGSFGGRGQAVEITFGEDRMDIETGPGFEPTSPFTPTPTSTPDQSVGTLIAEQTPTSTPGPSPTASDTPTITLTPSITFTPSVTPTASDTPTVTPTPSATGTPTDTPPPSDTPLPTDTPSITPTPSQTFTPSPTAILPPRPTVAPSATKPPP